MNLEKYKGRARRSWLPMGAMVALCGFLGFLQYRWLGEVSVAERERLRGSLQTSLFRLSQDFNGELTAACAALLPAGPAAGLERSEEEDEAARYARWKARSPRAALFRRVAIAAPEGDTVGLRIFDPNKGTFEAAEWPAAWSAHRDRMTARLSNELREGRRRPGPRGGAEEHVIELPRFGPPSPREGPGRPGWSGRRETAWLLLEVDVEYVRTVLLPELLQRHLGAGGNLPYQVEVLTRADVPELIYQSDPDPQKRIGDQSDAAVGLFELQYEQFFRSFGPPGLRERGPVRAAGLDRGWWRMSVRHHAGSLEAVVARARWRNLAVTAAVLVLMLVTVAAMIRTARRSERLAELQMDFVAGVSHELRTPLTVIRTAAYNLRGRMAQNPQQVERYGSLIENESEKLTALVEQVLQFASAKAGRVIREPEPVSIEGVIEEGVESSKAALEEARCVVEQSIEPGLPRILGDPMALRHALQNLLSNAAKYGSEGNHWIGVFASSVSGRDGPAIEIRVADRGPGIPADEQAHVFDPFYRGKRALQDQIHGTGLGLSLVKGIIEAHGGTIAVKSEPAKGTEFVMRIPVTGREDADEFADTPR